MSEERRHPFLGVRMRAQSVRLLESFDQIAGDDAADFFDTSDDPDWCDACNLWLDACCCPGAGEFDDAFGEGLS